MKQCFCSDLKKSTSQMKGKKNLLLTRNLPQYFNHFLKLLSLFCFAEEKTPWHQTLNHAISSLITQCVSAHTNFVIGNVCALGMKRRRGKKLMLTEYTT